MRRSCSPRSSSSRVSAGTGPASRNRVWDSSRAWRPSEPYDEHARGDSAGGPGLPARYAARLRLQALPVAPPLEADDPAEPRRLEVSRCHEDLLALQTVQQGLSSLTRQVRVHVGARDPVRLEHLHRAM